MNLVRALLILLLTQTAPQAPQAPQPRGSIGGFVVKMGSADPVSKARVTLTRQQARNETYIATTETAGRFSFQNLEAGQYRLSVQRNGYIRTEFGQRSLNRPGLPITLNAGQNITEVVLQLVPAGTVAGRIVDREGEPLPNVNVQALRYMYREGNRVLTSVQQARTNDLGEYRLFWLTPGQYYVSATYNQGQTIGIVGASPIAGPGIGGSPEGPRGGRGLEGRGGEGRGAEGRGGRGLGALLGRGAAPEGPSEDEGYIPVYFPNTTDAQTAAVINLGPGVTYGGVDLSISPVRTLRVRGQAIDATTGQPARGAQIMLIPRREGMGLGMNLNLRARTINDQGFFEIRGVVPGSYDVMAMMNNRNNRMTARVPVIVGGADVENIALVLSPGFTINGRLLIEGRPAAANDQDLGRVRVNLRPETGEPGQMGGPPPAAPVQANNPNVAPGSFTLQQVGPSDYRLSVTGMPQNHYVKMARLGSVDVLDKGLSLSEQPSAPLEILVSPNTATIEGSVTDDKQQPSINVTVVLVPDAARRHRFDLYRMTTTDAAGRFRLQGLAPGDYKVFAWEDVEQGAWQDPEFIRLYEDRGKSYRLTEGSQQNADLRAIPPQM